MCSPGQRQHPWRKMSLGMKNKTQNRTKSSVTWLPTSFLPKGYSLETVDLQIFKFHYSQELRHNCFLTLILKLLDLNAISLISLCSSGTLGPVCLDYSHITTYNTLFSQWIFKKKKVDLPEDLGNPIHTLDFPISVKEAIQALEKLFGVYGTWTHDRGFWGQDKPTE